MFLALSSFKNLVSIIRWIKRFDDINIFNAITVSYKSENLRTVRFNRTISLNLLKVLDHLFYIFFGDLRNR
jgi:hypothetical protein